MNRYQERVKNDFYRILGEKKLKLTKPRKALIEFLLTKRGWHFQAEELWRELTKKKPGVVSRATVYRTLEILVEASILQKTRIHENSFGYEFSGTEGHHHHLVDINTGKVIEFTGDKELHRMLRRVAREHNFTEQYHVLEVFGEFNKTPRKGTVRRKK